MDTEKRVNDLKVALGFLQKHTLLLFLMTGLVEINVLQRRMGGFTSLAYC